MHKTSRKMVVALSLLCLLVVTACQSGDKGESEKVTSDTKAKVVNIMETSGIPNASPTLADNSV
ncbi:peptide ABC transporter substrate-binding protein, partial [Listeria monocytogenes]|nr:peptide ABC transporter substrate-binding protein [Listeria monocytogenes]